MAQKCLGIRCGMIKAGHNSITLAKVVGGELDPDTLRHILRGQIKNVPDWIVERISRHLDLPADEVRQEIEDAARQVREARARATERNA